MTSSRDERQKQIHNTWSKIGGHGTLVAATGFGKTRVAINIIKSMNFVHPDFECDVVVPSTKLLKDWTKEDGHINEHGLKNVKVYVVNSYITKRRVCDFLVLDEIHNYAAETFSKVFEVCLYKYVLGLTATLEREDGREELIKEKAPVFDEVPIDECERNGWISPYITYNLGVELSPEDSKKQEEITETFNSYFAKFGHDFDLAQRCRGSLKPIYSNGKFYEPVQVKYARRMGWKGNTLDQAIQQDRVNRHITRGKKNIWGNKEHEFSPTNISEYAQKWGFYMEERQSFLHDAENKKRVAIELCKKFKDKKIIIFTERKDTCDEITERLIQNGIKATNYHSSISTEVRDINNNVVALGVKNEDKKTVYIDKETDKECTLKELSQVYGKLTRYGKDRLGEERIALYEKGVFSVLVTVKALDEGMDVKSVDLGITVAGKGVKRQESQRRGRTVRFVEGKKAIFVNLYVKETKDKAWLKERQKGSVKEPIWINSIAEITTEESKTNFI